MTADDVFILGASVTPFGKQQDSSVRALAEQATAGALGDAGLAPQDIDLVVFANAASGLLTGQEMIRGQAALRGSGLAGIPMLNTENACASASSAVHIATMAIKSGMYRRVLVAGAEKLTHADRQRSLDAIAAAADVDERDTLRAGLDDRGIDSSSLFMGIYASEAEEYASRSGATASDFALVAVKNRLHGSLNPSAQFRTPTSVEEVLASRAIAGPLTLLMCSAVGDGAAALVLSADSGPERSRAIRIRASRAVSGSLTSMDAAARAAGAAYESAGIGPNDVDVVELHDAATPAELMLYEDLQLCPPGGGVDLIRRGDTGLSGRIPVNPSGGLLSRGHPIGATGAAQLVELVTQLRSEAGTRQVEGARIALAENAGGHIGAGPAVAVVTILSRD